MRTLLIISAFIITITALGQQTKKRTIENKIPYSKEIFYVLKDSKEVKHGQYEKYTRYGLVERGQFENNVKTGIWEFLDYDGNIDQKFNYSNNRAENVRIAKWPEKYWLVVDGAYIQRKLDEEPYFIGGESRLFRIWKISYPVDARRNLIQGKVMISATITKEGKMIDDKIEKSLGYGCDEEALNAVRSIPDEWIPGRIDGSSVDVRILIPVTFELSF